MTLTAFTNVERPVRDWLQSQSITGIGARVYVGLPNDATLPAIEQTLIDGGVAPGEAPIANAFFSFSAWGAGTSGPERIAAETAAWALASLLQTTNYAALDDDLRLFGAQIVLGPTPRFDADGTPRYVVDAVLTLVKTA